MKTTDQRCLPSFKVFAATVRAGKLGLCHTKELLPDVYRLAKDRCRYQTLAEQEEKRSADLHNKVTRLKKLARDWENLASKAKALRAAMQLEEFNSLRFLESTSRVDDAIREVIALLDAVKQRTIDSIFPSRTRGLSQNWKALFPTYDLPRLGFKAPDTKFLLDVDTLLADFCRQKEMHITKKQHWEILKTFMYLLFNETVEAKAIEQLVRSRRRNTTT